MSEATDLAATEGEAPETPEYTEPEGTTFGFDDTEDTSTGEPESQSGQPEEETPQQIPTDDGGTLRQQDYTRKTQDLADERRAFEAKQVEWQEAQKAQQEQIQQTLQALQQTQQPQAQTGLVQQLQDVASNPNLTAEDRAGLNVIANLANELETAKQTIASLSQFQEQVAPQFEQINQTVTGLSAAQQQAQVAGLRNQLAEANEAFGVEVVEAAMPLVRRMGAVNGSWSPEVNPQTGEAFSIAEMVGLASGKLAQGNQEAQEAQLNGSRLAKKSVAGTGVTGTSKPGTFSEADAIAEIGQNQGR
jgi:hypothetical protein